jgi:glycerate 2-kinase
MTGRHVLAAPDKFRGSASAPEVAAAIAAGARRAGWSCTQLPLAHGGEGTLEALGGAHRSTTVSGPLGRPVEAPWRLDDDRVAVIEMARASGLQLAGGKEGNDPLAASTRGTGELIAAALDAGARRVVVGVGGSATTDGGRGAVDVLAGYGPFGTSGAAEVLVACDVRTAFVDAARCFAPQKGASPEQVLELTLRLEDLQDRYRRQWGVDLGSLDGAGAAGGLAGGLVALGARLVPGFELIAAQAGLDAALATADVVITSEGLLDQGSFDGKVVGGVVAAAAARDVPYLAVVGGIDPAVTARVPAVGLLDRFGAERAWADPLGCIEDAVRGRLSGLG